MNKLQLYALSAIALLTVLNAAGQTGSYLPAKIDSSGRYIASADGKPVFWIGEYNRHLLNMRKREASKYISDKIGDGMNIILCSITFSDKEHEGATKNIADYITGSRDSYFENMKEVVDIAEGKEMHLAIMPAVDDSLIGSKLVAAKYGALLGEKFNMYKNIVWVLGSVDRNRLSNMAIWRELGRSLKEKAPHHLITFYPPEGEAGGKWFYHDLWFDINTCNSDYKGVSYEYVRLPSKPILTVIGSPGNKAADIGGMNELLLFHSLISGSGGVIFESGNSDATQHIKRFRKFIDTYEWWEATPEPNLIKEIEDFYSFLGIAACQLHEHSKLMALFSSNRPLSVDLTGIRNSKIKIVWYNIATGEMKKGITQKPLILKFRPPWGWESAILIAE